MGVVGPEVSGSGKLAETPSVVRRFLRARGFGDLDGELEVDETAVATRRLEEPRADVGDR